MRIAKATLWSRWAWSSGLAAGVFAILALLDYRLKALTGVGTADLAFFSSAIQFQAAFHAWGPERYAVRAGFDLGFDYLLMPLYATAFFYSGVLTAEGFAPRPGSLRRMLMALVWVPVIGALADAAENALQLTMLLTGATDALAQLAASASRIKNVALLVGLALFLGAVMARFNERRAAKQSGISAL
ncbi:MAG TPA: hypothetical protein VNW15_09350 [Rhizomicrobium sp.]|nr:hypothetical protein [Rhizomicrobium sp.]